MLVLFIQFQPLQVYALVLDAEQSGHHLGLLVHSHEGEQAQAVTDSHTLSSVVDDTLHESECHPAHTLFSPAHHEHDVVQGGSILYVDRHRPFISIDHALDTPPPKFHSARS